MKGPAGFDERGTRKSSSVRLVGVLGRLSALAASVIASSCPGTAVGFDRVGNLGNDIFEEVKRFIRVHRSLADPSASSGDDKRESVQNRLPSASLFSGEGDL